MAFDFIFNKQASDDQIEGAFFQLAYQRLQDQAKNLVPYLVGFEIKKKTEDNTKALGVFGFRSAGGQILHIPAFFINGKVKPLDLLYSKNSERLFPLNEDIAEMFLKDELTGLGQPAEESRADILRSANQSGDFRAMAVPPRTGKQVIASVLDYVEASDLLTKKAFMGLLENDPEFLESTLRFYSPEKIAAAVAEIATQPKAKTPKSKAVQVVKKTDTEKAKTLLPTQKADLLTKGYIVLDERKPEQKAKFGIIQSAIKFTNPTKNGLYNYVCRDGGLRLGLVIARPAQLQQHFAVSDSFVLDLASPDATMYAARENRLFVKDKYQVEDLSEFFKMLVPASEVKPQYDRAYLLINKSLAATIPFEVIGNFKTDNGIRRIVVRAARDFRFSDEDDKERNTLGCRNSGSQPGRLGGQPKGNYYTHPSTPEEFTLIFTKKPGDTLQYKEDGVIYVPADFKFLEVNPYGNSWREDVPSDVKRKDRYQGNSLCETDDSDTKQSKAREKARYLAAPAMPSAITQLLEGNHIFPMTVHTNGSEYFVDINGAKKKYPDALEAKIGMILDVGLDEESADQLLASLQPGISKKGHVKLATLGDMSPQPFEEQPYTNELGQPTTTGIGVETMLPTTDGYTGNPTQLGLGDKPEVTGIDPKYVQQAVQLSASGQKEIFDAQTIGSLAKYVSVGDKITEYIPSIIEAIDRLGRILFLLHWETDKFKEMYGRTDLPEFVELITNTFKNLGDIIVFLKRKSPELSINMTKTDALDL